MSWLYRRLLRLYVSYTNRLGCVGCGCGVGCGVILVAVPVGVGGTAIALMLAH